MRELCGQISAGTCDSSLLERLLPELSVKLKEAGGRMVYDYQKQPVKNIIDRVVDELEKDERVAKCYDAWYEL